MEVVDVVVVVDGSGIVWDVEELGGLVEVEMRRRLGGGQLFSAICCTGEFEEGSIAIGALKDRYAKN